MENKNIRTDPPASNGWAGAPVIVVTIIAMHLRGDGCHCLDPRQFGTIRLILYDHGCELEGGRGGRRAIAELGQRDAGGLKKFSLYIHLSGQSAPGQANIGSED